MNAVETTEPLPSEKQPVAVRVRRLAALRLPWLLLLLATALAYYGGYYRHGIEFRDEGGTVTLNAMRLLAGEIPLKEVTLNYNVLWFYPITGLFKLFGASFVLARAYCLALSTMTAVLAFFAVDKVSRRPWLAFLVALLPLLVPGMTFKNYMPLLAVGNSFCLLHAALAPPGSREARRMTLIGGVVLGLTFLIRIDLGIFFTLLWMGFHVLRMFDRTLPWKAALVSTGAAMAITAAAVVTVHLPVYADAKRRGFDQEFLTQYGYYYRLLRSPLPPAAAPALKQAAAPAAKGKPAAPAAPAGSNLRRVGWKEMTEAKKFERRVMVPLTYAPLLSLSILVAWALVAFARAAISAEPGAIRHPLAALVMLGGALTTFPQFFFFRPDAPHLSEFSPGYWVAVTCACLLLGIGTTPWRGGRRVLVYALLVFLGLHAALYLARTLPDRWCGTIAARKNRTKLFQGENGVNVFLTSREQNGLGTISKLIREHSRPEDYLVAYPYHPAFNVLSNRRTYEKNVYVDNVMRDRNWTQDAILRFEQYRPAVIILSDWDINNTESSRFSVWATPVKTWIQSHYIYRGTYLDWYEIYTRE